MSRLILKGNEDVAKRYIPIGKRILENLKRTMALGRLTQSQDKRDYPDATIYATSSFNEDRIIIEGRGTLSRELLFLIQYSEFPGGQASGTMTISSWGTNGNFSSIKVNGVEVLGATVNYVTSLNSSVAALATQINTYNSTPEYTATSSGGVLAITAANSGASYNGYTITYTAGFVGLPPSPPTVSGTTPFSGGSDDAPPQQTYVVFKYPDGITLNPLKFNLTPYVNHVNTGYWGKETGGASVTSAKDYHSHYYTAGNTSKIDDSTGGSQNNFCPSMGVYAHDVTGNANIEGLCGLRTSFEPVAFNENNLAYPLTKSPVAVIETNSSEYYCSGRRDWYVINGEVRKNLRIELDGANPTCHYENAGGTQSGKIYSDTTYYDTAHPYRVFFGVIDDQEFFGIIKRPDVSSSNYDIYSDYFDGDFYDYTYIPYCTDSYAAYINVWHADPLSYISEHSQMSSVGAKQLIFGPHVLLNFGGASSFYTQVYTTYVSIPINHPEQNILKNGEAIPLVGTGAVTLFHNESWGSGGSEIVSWYCYDNVNGSYEEFICIFGSYIPTYSTQIYETIGGATSLEINFSGSGKKFYLTYKIKGMANPEIIELKTVKYGTTSTAADWGIGVYEGPNFEGGPCQGAGGTTTYNTTVDGQRLNKTSCYITDTDMLYTYVLEDWKTGAGAATNLNDADPDTNWTFNSRILGVINRKTGARKEYPVTTGNIGDSQLDITKAAAIGLHK